MKQDFESYKIGTIFNKYKGRKEKIKNKYEEIEIDYPSRLNAMAIDPSKIASNENMVYSPGEIIFSTQIFRRIKVKVIENNKLEISNRSKRKSLIKHTYYLMKEAINFKNGLYIDIDNENELKHIGLGSSSGLIAGIAAAINELFGNPIPKTELIKYLAQNHGEEIDNNNEEIMPVQCIGGSAAAGLYGDGLIVIAGKSTIIGSMKIDPEYKILIGIPKDFKSVDSKEALEKELDNIEGFIETGIKFGPKIAYEILHKALPGMQNNNLKPIGDIIFDYRYNMGSIKNCSFLYPKLIELTNNLAFLKKENIAEVLSISSVGPAIFAITKNPAKIKESFENNDLKIIETEIENNGYKIISKVGEKLFWNNKENVKRFINRTPDLLAIEELENLDKENIKGLDFGCGGGRHSELMALLNIDTYGFDFNEEMVKTTKNRLKNYYNKEQLNERIKSGNMLKVPFNNQEFDFVVSTGVLHQAKSLEEYEIAIKELSRVTKKDGIIVTNIFTSKIKDETYNFIDENTVITKDNVYMTLISKDQFIELMKKYGLIEKGSVIEEIKELKTGPRSILRGIFVKNA